MRLPGNEYVINILLPRLQWCNQTMKVGVAFILTPIAYYTHRN
jgi:hypothetical protein